MERTQSGLFALHIATGTNEESAGIDTSIEQVEKMRTLLLPSAKVPLRTPCRWLANSGSLSCGVFGKDFLYPARTRKHAPLARGKYEPNGVNWTSGS
jgi:hypothetical protein